MALWRPANFVLRGEYCPSSSIDEQLETYRVRYELAGLIVTACSVDGNALPALFAAYDRESAQTMSQVASMLGGGSTVQLLVESVFSPEGSRIEKMGLLGAKLEQDLQVQGCPVSIHSPAHMSNNQPVRAVVVAIGRKSGMIAQKHLDLLFTMVITHIKVRQAIDTAALSPLDEMLLIPEIDEHGSTDLEEMARKASELATLQTRSDLCIVFWRTFHNPWQPKKPTAQIRNLLSEIESDRSRHENLLAEMHSITFAKQYFGASSVILAAPIPGVLAGPDTPAAGIVLLRRSGNAAYTSHAINLVRAICLRLAVVRATAASGEVARLIADLGSLPLGPRIEPAEGQLSLNGPPHIMSALGGTEDILDMIALNTNSHSVSVRVAVGSHDVDEPHGFVLQRVFPAPSSGVAGTNRSNYDQQHQRGNGGINWRTAIDGCVNYVGDVHSDGDYLMARHLTESQLSVPIRAAGQLIGTLNLESPSRANYGVFLPYVEGIAGAIGRRFADAAQAVSRPILERAAEVLDRTHNYQAHLVRFRDHAKTLPLSDIDKDQIDTYIEECLVLIKAATIDPLEEVVDSPVTSLNWLIGAAISSEGVLNLRVGDRESVPELECQISSSSAGQLLAVLRSVLSNIKNHGGRSSSAEPSATIAPRIEFSTCKWDGRTNVVIRFLNSSKEVLDPNIAAQVYQVPIERRSEIRLGAYLAGLRMRQLGGYLTFSMSPASVARTIMMIPVDSPHDLLAVTPPDAERG